jgi:Phage integrase family
VLYSLRHTFRTRLGDSGCDAWTLARIAGHSSISISSRYVHPSHDAVLAAVEKLGGRKIGTVQKRLCRSRNQRGRYQFETVEDEWSATLADFEPDFSPSQHFQTLSLNCISLLLRLLRLMRAMRV